MSDRIALMSGGRVLQYDTPQNMFWRPSCKEAAEYFGKMNYVGEYEGVRPSSVKLTAEGDYEITEIVFMGEMAEVTLRRDGREILSQIMTRELEELGLAKGKTAGIRIEEGGRIYFEEG